MFWLICAAVGIGIGVYAFCRFIDPWVFPDKDERIE
jgi:hypothetical protein